MRVGSCGQFFQTNSIVKEPGYRAGGGYDKCNISVLAQQRDSGNDDTNARDDEPKLLHLIVIGIDALPSLPGGLLLVFGFLNAEFFQAVLQRPKC